MQALQNCPPSPSPSPPLQSALEREAKAIRAQKTLTPTIVCLKLKTLNNS